MSARIAMCWLVGLTACDLASGLSDFAVRGDESAVSSTGAMGGAAEGGSGGGPQPCATAPLDDFGDGMLTPIWMAYMPDGLSSVTEHDGRLFINVAAGAGNRWNDASTVSAYDMSECGASVRFEGAVAGVEMGYFILVSSNTDYAGFIQVAGVLEFYGVNKGVFELYGEVAYVPEAHRFWWLRVAGGQLEWLTSSDRKVWKSELTRVSHVTPTLYITLGAGIEAGGSTQGFTVSFDDLNIVP